MCAKCYVKCFISFNPHINTGFWKATRIIVYIKIKDKLIEEPLTSDAKSLENKGPGNKVYKRGDPLIPCVCLSQSWKI